MLNSLPYNKRGIAIANLIAGFGQRTYYRARKGERLLLPEEQQSVLNVFRHLDAGMATELIVTQKATSGNALTIRD